MNQSIGHVTLLVRDYDKAIAYFVGALRFTLVEDAVLPGQKRWVLVAPRGSKGTSLLLAKAASPRQKSRLGDQTGGRVSFFLHTDDFSRDYRAMKARGVRFLERPRNEPYGTVAVFEDICGNRWDLIELKAPHKSP
jgi:catechol 2,3-dioxygenase-like lactoylglutathione lyase family enzyme